MDKRKFFKDILNIHDERILKKFCWLSAVATYKKGTYLITKGESQGSLFFLVEGILRGFWGNPKGKEATECFVFRYGQAALGSYRLDQPPSVNVAAETNSTIVKLPKQAVEELLLQHTELVYVYNELLIREMEEHQNIKHAIYMLNAKERYNWFLREYKDLIDRVSHRHVASFLNMTPVTLSRLRKEFREQEE